MNIKFSISILVMNGLEHTQRCLESVLKYSTSQPAELLIWDNGSTDETLNYLDGLVAGGLNIRLHHVDRNIGFIEPNRRHLDVALGKYFIMLNNDAWVCKGWLEALEAPFLAHPKAALSAPRGGCTQLQDNMHGRLGGNVEYLEGSCLCGRADILRRHGLFDPSLSFAYGEDSDLSLRMREAGYTIHVANFDLGHTRGATAKNVPEVKGLQDANHEILRKRWGHYLATRNIHHPIVIHRRGAQGDVLLTTPIIRALKQRHPLSRIGVETDFPEILRGNPDVEDVRGLPDAMHIDLNMAYENRPKTNFIDAYAEVAGVRVTDRRLIFHESAEDTAWAAKNIPHGRCCALGCTPTLWPGKNWPAHRWAELAERLNRAGWHIVKVGQYGAGEVPGNSFIGRTSIGQMAALLRRCELFIGHDSLPMHLSYAKGTPTIGLFGVTFPEYVLAHDRCALAVWSDPAHPFSGIRHKTSGQTFVSCESNPMETISVQAVIEMANSL